jgi:Fe-S-cluster containining protein
MSIRGTIRLNRQSKFSYQCHACGRCCHDKVITLAPYDVMMIARAAGISTREAIKRFTIRRGSILRFTAEGACAALDGVKCGVHSGRPLACRLYPLGIERGGTGDKERFVRIDPAPGSAGVYGRDGSIAEFMESQGVPEYLAMNDRYFPLLAIFRERIAELIDFEKVEPREFWRTATREALAESGYDANPIIDALFDVCGSVEKHIAALATMVRESGDANSIASAAVLLAVSLGYSPAIAFASE